MRQYFTPWFLALAILAGLLGPALGVNPDEILSDPVLESRARAISSELRCLVCQNQSIDDSDADLARDLRLLVRERLVAGDSDAEVVNFLVDRYGEFVLLKPTFSLHTFLLWAAAPLVLMLAVFGLLVYLRRLSPQKNPARALPLSQEEQDALDSLKAAEDD